MFVEGRNIWFDPAATERAVAVQPGVVSAAVQWSAGGLRRGGGDAATPPTRPSSARRVAVRCSMITSCPGSGSGASTPALAALSIAAQLSVPARPSASSAAAVAVSWRNSAAVVDYALGPPDRMAALVTAVAGVTGFPFQGGPGEAELDTSAAGCRGDAYDHGERGFDACHGFRLRMTEPA